MDKPLRSNPYSQTVQDILIAYLHCVGGPRSLRSLGTDVFVSVFLFVLMFVFLFVFVFAFVFVSEDLARFACSARMFS